MAQHAASFHFAGKYFYLGKICTYVMDDRPCIHSFIRCDRQKYVQGFYRSLIQQLPEVFTQ